MPGTGKLEKTAFTCSSMESARFQDLQVKIGPGSPGLICHQYCCEHLVTIRDVRMHNPNSDPIFEEEYPFKISTPGVNLEHHRQCEVCTSHDHLG